MLPAEFHPPAAARFEVELARVIDEAREFPELFPPYLVGTRRAVLSGFPYLLVYVDRPDRIRVIAVGHGKRRPGYWRRRVS